MAQDKDPAAPATPNSWRAAGGFRPDGGPLYAEMIRVLREFLDRLAAANPDQATIEALDQDLQAWTDRLAAFAAPEREQMFTYRHNLSGRGPAMAPAFTITAEDTQSFEGVARFGRFFLGAGGAAHGGAIALLFDEVLGQLASTGGRRRSRTAYLRTDFRSITPIETDLGLRAWFVSEEGRKRLVRAEIRNGEVLCAEAEGLFVALLPGQP